MLENARIDAAAAEKALAAINPNWFADDTVIDLQRLLQLLAQDNSFLSDAATYRRMLTMSRKKLPGTDGIRGKIRAGHFSYLEALSLYLQEGAIAPALFELAAYSLASLLIENDTLASEDTCTFGEDGRDLLTKGAFARAVIRGFNLKGVKVYDTGVLATPGVVLYAAYAQSRIGAILTASHNPANQNGLKFIFDGFKLLEESSIGEFALTAMMYKLANSKQPGASKLNSEDVNGEAEKLLVETNSANSWLLPGELKNIKMVYDGANGAYSLTAPQVLERLRIAHTTVNTNPLGHNINKGGGVAELEGVPFFDGKSSRNNRKNKDGFLPVVVEIMKAGRKNPNKLVVGLVNDGDGDRGYLLVYDRQSDRVRVLSGDELAIWIAEGMRDRGEVTSDSIFVASVECDLRVTTHAQSKLNLRTEIACVGDKWLLQPARQGKDFAIGVEESGHVTFACEIENRNGRSVRFFTGNGLLSVLRVLAVINSRKADLHEILHPFESGFKHSRTVYFVDKSRFYPESRVWQEDVERIHSQLRSHLHSSFSIEQVEFENDPFMLYFTVVNGTGHSVAAIFVRNSGTENKTVVTIRGARQFEAPLIRTMLAIHRHHILTMKDMDSEDAIKECIVKELLKTTDTSPPALKTGLEKRLNASLSYVDFDALIYAMRKQGFVTFAGGLLHLHKP